MKLSQKIQHLAPSATFAVDAQVKKLQATGKDVLNLTLGEPDFKTPENISQAGIDAIQSGFTHYTPAAGIAPLRVAIANKLKIENGLDYAPEQITVGVGTKNILTHALQTLCDPGDEVLIATPTWSTYLEMVKLADGVPITFALAPPFKLRAQDLEPRLTPRTKILILNSPCNPTGAVIDEQELHAIADLVVAHDLFVLSDEIYEHLIYEGKHTSIASLNPEIFARTLTINGFSKSYAMTGWRIGYAAGPQELITAMNSLAGQTTSGTSTIAQMAGIAALTGDQTALAAMKSAFARRRSFLLSALSSIKPISFSPPEGAFYVFFDVSKLFSDTVPTSQAWTSQLLEKEGVALVPGEAFLAPGYVRMSYAVSDDVLKEAVKRIARYIDIS